MWAPKGALEETTMRFKKESMHMDWCHLCAKNRKEFVAVSYESDKFIRICRVCLERMLDVINEAFEEEDQ